jgi:CD2 antigen cytoplasmic tail-binding protein 2
MSEKRKRHDASSQTEEIIQAALREQQEAKKAKRQMGPGKQHAFDKGKTLGDMEEEEGGPVKESQVAMAHVKRTQKRKARKEAREGACPNIYRSHSPFHPLCRYSKAQARAPKG